jgi:hypothetical protein
MSMKRCAVPLCVIVFILLGTDPARADLISWSYDWAPGGFVIPAELPGTGGITLTDEPVTQVTGTAETIATHLMTFSSAPADTPDRVTNRPYSLSLRLYDDASSTSGTLTFAGLLDGTISVDDARITNTFTDLATQSITLGSNVYTVEIGPYAPPGPPNALDPGSIAASISIASQEPPPEPTPEPPPPAPVTETPEPSSMMLAGVGLSVLGGSAWRKWKRKRRAAFKVA